MRAKCIKDVIMNDGSSSRTFTEGEMYKVEDNGRAINDDGVEHTVSPGSFFFEEYFIEEPDHVLTKEILLGRIEVLKVRYAHDHYVDMHCHSRIDELKILIDWLEK